MKVLIAVITWTNLGTVDSPLRNVPPSLPIASAREKGRSLRQLLQRTLGGPPFQSVRVDRITVYADAGKCSGKADCAA